MKKLKKLKKLKMFVTLTEVEKRFWQSLASHTKLTPSELMTSVLRRHMKSRYIIPRKEWYYVFK